MYASGVRGLLIYCSGYRCGSTVAISADRWADDVRVSDLEPKFACKACAAAAPTSARIGNRLRQMPEKGWDRAY